MSSYFYFPDPKIDEAQFSVSVDISAWLGTDTISSVEYTARKVSDDTDATSDVLDVGKCTEVGDILYPYIKGGTVGETYRVKCQVTTVAGDVDDFYIQFIVAQKT